MYNPIARINLQNLVENSRYIQQQIGEAKILAVVKADAYGHGLPEIARKLENAGVYGFSVALYSEIQALLSEGITRPILHLGRLHIEILDLCKKGQVRCTVNSLNDIDLIEKYASADDLIKVHLKIDTGMGRMGIHYKDAESIIKRLYNNQFIQLEGIWSHLATSENENLTIMRHQVDRFSNLTEKVKENYPEVRYFHIANSAAMLKSSDTHFNMVRPGVALYGVSPFSKVIPELKPVMRFEAPLVLRKRMEPGQTIGYGCTYSVEQAGDYGIIQAGYADGVPTAFGRNGEVYTRGGYLNITGRISMDMCSVNCSESDIEDGVNVTFWGQDDYRNRVEFLAAKCKMLPYELLTGISKRVKRIYDSKELKSYNSEK